MEIKELHLHKPPWKDSMPDTTYTFADEHFTFVIYQAIYGTWRRLNMFLNLFVHFLSGHMKIHNINNEKVTNISSK